MTSSLYAASNNGRSNAKRLSSLWRRFLDILQTNSPVCTHIYSIYRYLYHTSLYVCPLYLPIYLYMCLFVYLSINQSIYRASFYSLYLLSYTSIPDDVKEYPLPPDLGNLPLSIISSFSASPSMPKSWVDHGGIFMPMYQREALWLSFKAKRPVAVKIGIGKINAISGEPWSSQLSQVYYNNYYYYLLSLSLSLSKSFSNLYIYLST